MAESERDCTARRRSSTLTRYPTLGTMRRRPLRDRASIRVRLDRRQLARRRLPDAILNRRLPHETISRLFSKALAAAVEDMGFTFGVRGVVCGSISLDSLAIKRTKFKLSPEQLVDMFYWLKRFARSTERLRHPRAQGQGAAARLHRHRPGKAIIVGTCFGLKADDYICPLHRDLGAFLMKGVEPRVMMCRCSARRRACRKAATRPAQRRQRARHLRQHEHARRDLPVAAGLGLTFKMERIDNVVIAYFGRRPEQHGRLSRGAQLRRPSQRLADTSLRVAGAESQSVRV